MGWATQIFKAKLINETHVIKTNNAVQKPFNALYVPPAISAFVPVNQATVLFWESPFLKRMTMGMTDKDRNRKIPTCIANFIFDLTFRHVNVTHSDEHSNRIPCSTLTLWTRRPMRFLRGVEIEG